MAPSAVSGLGWLRPELGPPPVGGVGGGWGGTDDGGPPGGTVPGGPGGLPWLPVAGTAPFLDGVAPCPLAGAEPGVGLPGVLLACGPGETPPCATTPPGTVVPLACPLVVVRLLFGPDWVTASRTAATSDATRTTARAELLAWVRSHRNAPIGHEVTGP